MRAESKKDTKEQSVAVEGELRRSSRQRKEPKNDDFFMGSTYLEEVLGHNNYDDDCGHKRRRMNYRYDDSEDYSEGHKCSKKSKQINSNKVESLLEWRFQLQMLPIIVSYLPDEPITPIEQLHKVKTTKSVANQNLLVVAQDIEVIFINIDWGKKGQTLKDFQQLKLQSNKLMPKGLVFVWAPKEYISEMLEIMEKKDFAYIQNFQIINFDIEKAKVLGQRGGQKSIISKNDDKKEDKTQVEPSVELKALIKTLDGVNPCDLIANEPSQYFNRSKRTLLMFKKQNNHKLQLRHQRTCDVVFDMPAKLEEKCDADLKSYIYNMIETLLPDCLAVTQRKKNEFHYKMLELWGDKDEPRRGWISVVQE